MGPRKRKTISLKVVATIFFLQYQRVADAVHLDQHLEALHFFTSQLLGCFVKTRLYCILYATEDFECNQYFNTGCHLSSQHKMGT